MPTWLSRKEVKQGKPAKGSTVMAKKGKTKRGKPVSKPPKMGY